jgi:hypothetical protein
VPWFLVVNDQLYRRADLAIGPRYKRQPEGIAPRRELSELASTRSRPL